MSYQQNIFWKDPLQYLDMINYKATTSPWYQNQPTLHSMSNISSILAEPELDISILIMMKSIVSLPASSNQTVAHMNAAVQRHQKKYAEFLTFCGKQILAAVTYMPIQHNLT